MGSYLTPCQIHILANAAKATEPLAASRLYTKPGIKAKDVRELYATGYLDFKDKKFSANQKTFKSLADHGFEGLERDISSPVQNDIEKVREFANKARSIGTGTLNVEALRMGLIEMARRKARGGDPWDWIRLQWPELVIDDPIDLKYFKMHCHRTEALDLRIDDRQYDLIKHALAPKRVKEIGIKGSTSPGKGFATAILINIWYDIYTNDRIIIIGPSQTHARDVMFGEVSKWRRAMKFKRNNEVSQAEGIKDLNCEQHKITVSSPEAAESVSGLHGLNTLFVLDESSRIPDEIYVSVQKPARLIIAISNPRILSGWFRSWFPDSDPNKNQIIIDRGIRRSLLTFGGQDCLNVKARRLNEHEYSPPGGIEITDGSGNHHAVPEGELIPESLYPYVRALIPAQMDYAKYTSIMQGRDENVRCWSGEGKFPPEDVEFQVCPPSWLKEPNREWEHHHEEIKVIAFGLDVAYSLDNDETVLSAGGVRGIRKFHKTRKANTLETAKWVIERARVDHRINLTDGNCPVAVDCIGVGGPVADVLADMGVLIIRIYANKAAEDPKVYMNVRAELYGEFGERLNPENYNEHVFMLPPDTDLERELSAHEKEYDRDMLRYGVTPKRRDRGTRTTRKSISERIGRSPDVSDSAVMCLCAVRQTDEDSSISEQFKPARVINRYEELRDGRILVSLADGSTNVVSKQEFQEIWGVAPPSVEQMVNSYMAAINSPR